MDYQVKLPVFEGPLDLLLHIIEKRELDITAISLAQVTDQYLEHLSCTEELDPDSLVEFVVVAAKLLVIKSSALLPSRTPSPEEEEIANELTTALIEYQLFKRAAQELRQMEDSGTRTYSRSARPVLPPPPVAFGTMSPNELLEALLRLSRSAEEPGKTFPIPSRIYTISEKIETIQLAVSEQPRVKFVSLLSREASRLEIIVTLLAALELMKKGQVDVEQTERFGEIYLVNPNTHSPGSCGSFQRG